jgi:antitoxin FitA
MAQLIVRQLEASVKENLRQRAKRHSRSLEEEVREILRDAAKPERGKNRRLGTEVARLFRRIGLKQDEGIRELRGVAIEPVAFDE